MNRAMKASTTEPPDLDAPPLHVSLCFNTRELISLQALRGRVVAIHTFQMLCPCDLGDR